VTTRF